MIICKGMQTLFCFSCSADRQLSAEQGKNPKNLHERVYFSMCVIAISPKGKRIPSESELLRMWINNPHGGGYMVARHGRVEIHKGFMIWEDFIRSVRSEKFTKNDPVVFHFRIATQGGICPEMTHPFPLTNGNLPIMKALDVVCEIGVAHNGIIPLTSYANGCEYSDTALFIDRYLSFLVRSDSDMMNPNIKRMISELGNSKFALMDHNGNISTVGIFYNHNGVLLSNENHVFALDYFLKGEDNKCIAF